MVSAEIEQNIVKDYNSGMRIIDIAKKYKLDPYLTVDILDAMKVTPRECAKMPKLERLHREMILKEAIDNKIDFKHMGGGLSVGGPYEGFYGKKEIKVSVGHYSGGRTGYFISSESDMAIVEKQFKAAVSEMNSVVNDYERKIESIMSKHGFKPE